MTIRPRARPTLRVVEGSRLRDPSTPVGAATSFVGRAGVLEVLDRALEEDAVVTLTGPPGVGKSRLLRFWAETRGAALVNLSGADARDAILARIGEALSAPSADGSRAFAAVGARPLLAFDHAELGAAALGGLLAAWHEPLSRPSSHHGGGLPRFVVATRSVLALPNERLVEVPPLGAEDAFSLFVQRARAARSGFSPEGSEAAIHRIIARLDALPLAIELCAARMRVLSPEQVEDHMARSHGVFGVGGRALRDAIASSVERLSPGLRGALAACAVFRGSFSLEAAEAVLPPPESALDAIAALADCSLLFSVEGSGKERRYRLYESVRELVSPESPPESVLRHEAYFAGLSARPRSPRELAVDRENLRVAYDRAQPERPIRALEIALALEPLLRRFGPADERVRLPSAALEGPGAGALPPPLRIDALLARAEGHGDLGDRA